MSGTNFKLDKKRILQLALIAILLIVVIYTVLMEVTDKQEVKISRVGDAMPKIELLDMQDQSVTLKATATKDTDASAPMLINLWATWCKPCINELPLLNEAQTFAPEVTFVAINMQESKEKIEPFIERYDLTMLVLRDEQLNWKRAVAAQGYPVTVLVDQNGIIQHIHRGEYTSIEEILEHTSKLVAGEAISS